MDHSLRGQWGNRDNKDFLYQIAFDFVAQLEEIMESEGIGRAELAQRLSVSKGRVSQILNNPGNLTLQNVVKYTRALNRKVSIVAYDDGDTERERGPIHPQIFVACWKKSGQPTDMFAARAVTASTTGGCNRNQNAFRR
jgi:transcriptional regulator with XRE-family HTH domain